MSTQNLYQLNYYVPEKNHEELKQRLFSAGAGKLNNYDQCCWQILGGGQFRPLKNSKPTSGKLNQLQKLKEYKVEMICQEQYLQTVLENLLKYHPYEQPAYHIVKIVNTRLHKKNKLQDK
ncbi:MAG: NGG1p interacting factor NIF3 [Pseudomonadota bacterium]